MSDRDRGVSRSLLAVAIVALVLGIGLRFYHIDRKVYSGDEVYTSIHMLGASEGDIVQSAERWHDAHDLWLVLHPTPAQGDANPLSPAHALAVEDPEHPPIYYLLGHQWIGIFGNSIAGIRSMSAAISLLVLPLAFWLGVELYGSQTAGWIAVALFALSPVGILYAQEAREYALWTAAVIALGAALLRAIRLDRAGDWWLVACIAAFGLYVYPLHVLVLVGLFAYVLATQWKNGRVLRRCGLAFAVAVLSFVPWLVVIFRHFGAVVRGQSSMRSVHLTAGEISRAFTGLLRLNILDLNFVQSSKLGIAATAVAVLLLVVAVAFVVRREPARVRLFLIFPILATVIPLLGADFIGGQSVRIPRYFTVVYLFLDYCLVGLILAGVAARNARARGFGYLLLAALLVARGFSAAASSQATTWWSKMQDTSIPVADVVNRAQRPLLVSDNILDYALVLTNYLRPDVSLALRPHCYLCTGAPAKLDASVVPPGAFTEVFALGPSPELQALLPAAIAQRGLHLSYVCINARHNCVSDLNVEPVFGPAVPVRPKVGEAL